MTKGDKVTGVYYTTRSDGVKLFRFAVPNTKHINDKGEEVWDKPQFKIRQDQTGALYDEAIDVENAPYTYTETNIPTESDIDPTPEPETDLTVADTLEAGNQGRAAAALRQPESGTAKEAAEKRCGEEAAYLLRRCKRVVERKV